MTIINSGKWWYKGLSKNKFNLTKFTIENFNDLKKIFKFSKQNWELFINNKKIKKVNYNFYINGRRTNKKEIINLIEGEKK